MNVEPRYPHLMDQSSRQAQPVADAAASRRAVVLERLLDLAYDASSYLRRNADRLVRISAALLLAASVAACNGEPTVSEDDEASIATAEPLAQEVRTGLPTAPGRYPIHRDSVLRDAQGVYHFDWREPTAPADSRNVASVSLLRLAEGDVDELEVAQGQDPILRVKGNEPIAMMASAADLRSPTPQAGFVSSRYYWYPFPSGGYYRDPFYYDPPARTISSAGTVEGAVRSAAPRPAAERTIGLPHAVSGRAGGTGTGTAASSRSGALASSSKSAGSGQGGVSAAKSSGFSGGKGSTASASSS